MPVSCPDSCIAVACCLILAGCTGQESPTEVVFRDVTADVGIDFVHRHGAAGDYDYPETFGSGAAWLDVDGDGRLDLYLVNSGSLTQGLSADGANQLFRQTEAGRFADVTISTGAGNRGYGMGATVADVEGDGDVDLFVTNVGANALLIQHQGRFTDQSQSLDVAHDGWATASGWFDADLDGDLDLAVVNYVVFDRRQSPDCRQGAIRTYCDPDRFEPTTDLLYRNDGTTTPAFTDISDVSGFTATGRGLGLALQDIDLDGDTDLYVANDGTANHLYRNDSNGSIHLTSVGLASGLRFNANGLAEAGMGVDAADVDLDGWPDLVVSNFSRETNTLYRHVGHGVEFRDVTAAWGLQEPSFLPLGFGIAFLDVDGDGDADMAVANGHVLDRAADVVAGSSYAQPDQLFINTGSRFTEMSAALGTAWSAPRVSRALVPGDFDGDGDEDLLITTSGGAPRLLRNDTPDRRWLSVRLAARNPKNRQALGARVVVDVEGRRLTGQLQDGGSYLSRRPPEFHVGLGDAAQAWVTVSWPGGSHHERWQLSSGRHRLVQGEGETTEPAPLR